MLFHRGRRRVWQDGRWSMPGIALPKNRALHGRYDGRSRLSQFWAPTQARSSTEAGREDGHDLLVRAGYLRQAYSGIFHFLPLGLRVQEKIERLIDKHMQRIGASKVSLSSISSQKLWHLSGRFHYRDAEFFKLSDRRNGKFLLAPTHEEEITMVVRQAIHSYKNLPLRVYQMSRKYRDEARPRQGLLRGREFLMKDLYTFDHTEDEAKATYEDVRRAYSALLAEIGLPYLAPQAHSGNMGGNLSHEYHFVSPKGEDTIIGCDSCEYLINEELYAGQHSSIQARPSEDQCADEKLYQTWQGISQDKKTLVTIYIPSGSFQVNIHAAKALFPNLNASTHITQKMGKSNWSARVAFHDPRLPPDLISRLERHDHPTETIQRASFLLTKARNGDSCPRCDSGKLQLSQAIEIGHTFHLGQRYSTPLEANVLDADNNPVSVQMGCHGIGVSRLIGAVASLLADDKGLNWPNIIAPFHVLLVGTSNIQTDDIDTVHDSLCRSSNLDVMIDDRDKPMGWKLNDADLIGYPFIVIMGKSWAPRRMVELQCRRLGIKEELPVDQLGPKITQYSQNL